MPPSITNDSKRQPKRAAPSCGALSSSHSENVCLNKPNELLKNGARLAIDILLALHSLHRSYRDGLDTRLQKIGSNRRAAAKGFQATDWNKCFVNAAVSTPFRLRML